MAGEIAYEDFLKLELRVAKIEAAERILGTAKLIKLSIDLGTEKRQLVAGIADTYTAENIVGKKIIVLTNLKPKVIKGLESKGMLLAADLEGKAVLLTTDMDVPVGSLIR